MAVNVNIEMVCDKCGDKLNIGTEQYFGVNPEYYVYGFSIHQVHEEDWSISRDEEVICNKCGD